MSRTRRPKQSETPAANDNLRQPGTLKASRQRLVDIRLPERMPVQIVEVEVLAELLDSLPGAANDNDQG